MIPNSTSVWSGTAVGVSMLANGVVVIEFDNKEKRVNILSSAVLAELSSALDEVGKLTGVSGVVFVSAKETFIVGADINEISVAQTLPWQASYQACVRGKALFARIAGLSYPTVAAIHGRCLGGGAELALACKKRIVTDSETTLIGLPEVALGVLPGFGGTVRATRLIGLKMAVALVLSPMKPWSAKKAWRSGLVSEVVPPANLRERAIAVAQGSRTKDFRFSLGARLLRAVENSRFGRAVVQQVAERQIEKVTGDKYPAPYKALEVMVRGAGTDVPTAMNIESAAFAKLVQTPQSRELVGKFLAGKKS